MSPRQRAVYIAAYAVVFGLLAWVLISLLTRRAPSRPVSLPLPPTPLPLRVHVSGAVAAPGVYDLPPGSIAEDAIAAAGGATPSADLSTLNLARLLRDGDQVTVPALAPTRAPQAAQDENVPAPAGQPLNLNTATVAQLEALPGIGPALAQRIVDYREANGPFAHVDDLLAVPGIGPAKLDLIRDLVTVQ
jgi:competence protein ComEA